MPNFDEKKISKLIACGRDKSKRHSWAISGLPKLPSIGTAMAVGTCTPDFIAFDSWKCMEEYCFTTEGPNRPVHLTIVCRVMSQLQFLFSFDGSCKHNSVEFYDEDLKEFKQFFSGDEKTENFMIYSGDSKSTFVKNIDIKPTSGNWNMDSDITGNVSFTSLMSDFGIARDEPFCFQISEV